MSTSDATAAAEVATNRLEAVRRLVGECCHHPLMVRGQFVALYEHERSEFLHRRAPATFDELIHALRIQIRSLQTANAYLRSQIERPPPPPDEPAANLPSDTESR